MSEKLDRLVKDGLLDEETKEKVDKLDKELDNKYQEEKKDLRSDLFSFGALMDNL